MATASQNATTILTGILNGAPTTAQTNRMQSAFARMAPVGATAAQIAAVFDDWVRSVIVAKMQELEAQTLVSTNNASVSTDFTPLP